jgi:hypothetical protein
MGGVVPGDGRVGVGFFGIVVWLASCCSWRWNTGRNVARQVSTHGVTVPKRVDAMGLGIVSLRVWWPG